jgi:hypothetical protein
MLSQIVGPVDGNSAFVLVAIFAAFTIVCAIAITAAATKKSARELAMQFEIDKQKLANEDTADKRQQDRARDTELAKMAIDKDVAFRRIETGLIEGRVER